MLDLYSECFFIIWFQEAKDIRKAKQATASEEQIKKVKPQREIDLDDSSMDSFGSEVRQHLDEKRNLFYAKRSVTGLIFRCWALYKSCLSVFNYF